MYVNVNQLNKLQTELADVVVALQEGKTVEFYDGEYEGWCETTQINLHLNRDKYRIL